VWQLLFSTRSRPPQQITFFEEGEPLVDGEPGDLVFVVRQVPEKRFERRGHDLLHNFTISLVDALTGFSTTLEHLDGHKVTLSATGVTRPGDWHQIAGEGMPIHGQEHKHGDLWIQYTVSFPSALSEEQKETVRKLFT
jgi:DnaJ family protein B protein 11